MIIPDPQKPPQDFADDDFETVMRELRESERKDAIRMIGAALVGAVLAAAAVWWLL